MSILAQLMETNEVKHNYAQNKELYEAIDEAAMNLEPVINSFVLAHLDEFVGPTMESTMKNIKTFSSFTTQQALVEMTSIVNNIIFKEDTMYENTGVSEYI